jgi:nitrogen fixation/metabolism regulation signal transduction histidine kinase
VAIKIFSLEGKYTYVVLTCVFASVLLSFVLSYYLPWQLGLPIALLSSVVIVIFICRRFTRPITLLIDALINSTHNFKDKDFTTTIACDRNDELGELVRSLNEAGELIREERQNLYQRELLLEAIFEATPVVMLLTDNNDRVIYANIEARRMLSDGKRLEGFFLNDTLGSLPAEVAKAVRNGETGLISLDNNGESQSFYIENRQFRLNARRHTLQQIREMSRELGRQEVAIWKKVIRVISHELNNSLAPISSLAHSGKIALGNNDVENLEEILTAIADRSQHLKSFIESYVKFARLSSPQLQAVLLLPILHDLQIEYGIDLETDGLEEPVMLDSTQYQHLLINLIRNALEADESRSVSVSVKRDAKLLHVAVRDKGPGMNKDVLQNALLPFYSTKQNGTGLGLALCREIVEAHNGQIGLSNLAEGGLEVRILLPV